MEDFVINFLDHVAIRVQDVEESAKWYQKVLGLKRGDFPEWRNYPLFMHCGKSGVAIFPANTAEPELKPLSKNVKIDHFAFNVSQEDFEKVKSHFKRVGQPFKFQDHYYYHSVYTKDPDNHTVEVTTLVMEHKSLK